MDYRAKMGDVVKHEDADTADNVPAYRDMRGVVIWVNDDGTACRVRWQTGVPDDEDVHPRRSSTLAPVSP